MKNYEVVEYVSEGERVVRVCPYCIKHMNVRGKLRQVRRRKNGDKILFCELCRGCYVEPDPDYKKREKRENKMLSDFLQED